MYLYYFGRNDYRWHSYSYCHIIKIDEKFKEIIISKIPSARLGEPDDIANAVLFLASSDSDYINGETLHVNGGLYMAWQSK